MLTAALRRNNSSPAFVTAELRWFKAGSVPAVTAQWFQSLTLGEHLPSLAAREDTYLPLPSCPYLGIKLREGRLDIKLRRQIITALQVQDRIAGQVETWSKWSCEDPAATTLIPAAIITEEPWMPIQKSRSQRQYQQLPDHPPVSVPVNQDVEQGCTVEITALKLGANPWWSLAFEAFGPEANLSNILQTTAHRVCQTYQGPDLLAQDSYAYPAWLAKAIP